MRTFADLAQWCEGAAEELGDPAQACCLSFFRWQADLANYHGEDLACGIIDGEFMLLLAVKQGRVPLPIRLGEAEVTRQGPHIELVTYGAELVTQGVWAVDPSLNIEGMVHTFVVLYDVPDPAPWGVERRILLP